MGAIYFEMKKLKDARRFFERQFRCNRNPRQPATTSPKSRHASNAVRNALMLKEFVGER